MLHHSRRFIEDQRRVDPHSEEFSSSDRYLRSQKIGREAIGARAVGTQALGALAIGAIAIGALAVGALAIGWLSIGRARVRRVEIGDLIVRRLRITGELELPEKLK